MSVSLARAVSIVLALVSVIITTRVLVPSQYAILAYMNVVATFMLTATSAWTAATMTRYGREELEERGSMRRVSSNRLLIMAPLLVLAGPVVVSLKVAGAMPAEFTWTFVWLALASGFLLIASEHAVNVLEAGGRIKLTALVLTLRQAVVLLALAAVVVAGHPAPVVIASVSVVASLGLTVALVPLIWRLAVWPPSVDRSLLRSMAAFSLPLVAFSVSQYVIRGVDIVVLRAYGTATETGVYAVAYQAYSNLQAVATTSTIVLTPLFVSLHAANKSALIVRYLERIVPQVTFLAAVGAGLCVPLLDVVVPLVFGRAFRGASEPLAILFVGFVLFAYASFGAPILLLYKRSGLIGLANAAGAAVNVVGDIVLIGPLKTGVVGPAIATSAALAVISLWYQRGARAAVGSRAPLRPWGMAPLCGGLVPTLLLSGTAAVVCGLAGAVMATVAVLTLASPFARQDADIVAKLDIPAPIKRVALRGLARLRR